MNQKTEKRKNGIFKTLLIAAIMVATVTGAFYGTTQVAAAAENNKVTTLPTAYPISASIPATPEQAQAPEGYVKPAYTIVDNSLEYYRDKKPTANVIHSAVYLFCLIRLLITSHILTAYIYRLLLDFS